MSEPLSSGADHVGITVPDLDEAVGFFTDVLGWRVEFRYERRPEPGSSVIAERMDAHPEAWFELAGVRAPNGTWLELFAWHAADQRQDVPRNSDLGGFHLAVGVPDVDAARARLAKVRGGRLLGDVMRIADGPLAGVASLFYRTPWGLHLELIQRPR